MFINIDDNSSIFPFILSFADKKDVTKEDYYPFVDKFKDTKVTDIMFNINAQSSTVDSAFFDNFADKYLLTEENGQKVDYREEPTVKAYYVAKYIHKIDPFSVWIPRALEIGITPWLSFRMNDCHWPDGPAAWIRDSYFYEAQKNGLMNGEKYGYYRNTYNYKYPKIREKFLGYIKEQLDKYDAYGVELDFMREMYCFDYISDDHDLCVGIMNEFIRSVRKITKEAEIKKGHSVKLAVRLARDLEKSLRFGFDARAWAKDNLVDVIIPSPRWGGSDSAIPIEEWKAALPGVQVFGCIETNINVLHPRWPEVGNMNIETICGHGASLLSRGADELYGFNLFGEHQRNIDVWPLLGSYEEIVKNPMRFIIVDEDHDIFPVGTERWKQLPIIPEDEKTVIFKTGNLPSDKTVRLILAFDEGTPDDVEVSINEKSVGKLSPCAAPDPKHSAYTDGAKCYDAVVKLESDTQNITVKKISSDKVVISWLELDVR